MQFRGHERELSGGDILTTNNRMELTAAIEALKALRRPCTVDLYTDSTYVREGITNWIAPMEGETAGGRRQKSRSRTPNSGKRSTGKLPAMRSPGTGCADMPEMP